jgi:hypothetical protein
MGWNWKGESAVQGLFDSPDSFLASFISGTKPETLFLVFDPWGEVKTRKGLMLAENTNAQGIQAVGFGTALFKSIPNLKSGNQFPDLHSTAQQRRENFLQMRRLNH